MGPRHAYYSGDSIGSILVAQTTLDRSIGMRGEDGQVKD